MQGSELDSVYLVTPYFPADLSQVIKSPQMLTEQHAQVMLLVVGHKM